MNRLIVLLLFVQVSSQTSPHDQVSFPKDGNFALLYKDQERKMETLLESPSIRDLLEREEFDPVTAQTTMADERSLAGILENRETILGELEGQALPSCLQDVRTYFANLSSGAGYAVQMRTSGGSFGRIANVLYTWRLEYLGSYDLCVDTKKDNPDAPFETLYCTEHIPFGDVYLKRGRCMPATCTNEDLDLIYNTVYRTLGLDFFASSYYTCIRNVQLEPDAIVVACLFGFFVLIVAVGTFYDIFYRRRCPSATSEEPMELESKTPKTLESNGKMHVEEKSNGEVHANGILEGPVKHQSTQELFMTSEQEEEDGATEDKEANRNTTQEVDRLEILSRSCSAILTADKVLSAKKNSSSFNCLNGIRVLSMFWIIWGHCNTTVSYIRIDNLRHFLQDVVSAYWFNMTFFGTFAVDTFFVLSGLLVTYLTLKELNVRRGKMNWFLYYFHRFWRLTPAYMMTIAYYTSLKAHVGAGADKFESDTLEARHCRQYWWTNLIYINNLYPFPGIVGGCLAWSWYLACDMQFFILTPLYLILLYKRKFTKYGLAFVVFTCFASCAVTAALTGYYGLPVGKGSQFYNDRLVNLEPHSTNSDVVYGKPYTRIQSYMVGIFVGYMLYRHFHVKKINIHWMVNIVAWIVAIGTLYAMLFALHSPGPTDDPLPHWFSALWGGVEMTIWSIALSWVAFACCTGRGGLINSFLSLSFWTPLARLTYGAYLLHPIIIVGFLRTKKVLFYWSFSEMLFFSTAVTAASYFLALLMSVFIEAPTVGLERAVFGRKK